MRQAYFIGGLILGLAIAIFALQNTAQVAVRFLVWQAQGPLAVMVLASATVGALVALLVGIPEILTARYRIRDLEHRLEGIPPEDAGPETPSQ
jgi:uncharacterized integral membrane protein